MIDPITIFLAQIWGPIFVAMSFGIFISRDYYLKIYRDLEKETLAVLCFGLLTLSLGIVQVEVHNVWGTLPQIIISFLGWAMLAKGIVLVVKPELANRAGDWFANAKSVSIIGSITLIGGLYLTWFAYFM